MSSVKRVVYLGTPEIAVPPLRALVESGIEVALVVTGADKRRGRGKELSPSPVKAAAIELGLPVAHDPHDLLGVEAELGVVVAYGRIIKPEVLDHVDLVNIHFSLLPRWRGAAPLERAILAGDDVTGVCLMEIAEELDAGGVYASTEVPIGPDDDLVVLRDKLTHAGVELLISTLSSGLGAPEPQAGEITWAHKLSADDFRLDWTRSAAELGRIVRLGRAHTTFRGKRFRIHAAAVVPEDRVAPAGELERTRVACGTGQLELINVQPEGKPRMPVADWLNGAQLRPGDALGLQDVGA